MKHEHLPALNRYTSSTQYEALVEIDKTKSIVGLLMKGSMSKTVGSLIRSAWVKAENHTDEDGVIKEGWVVTDAGKHAMRLYDIKMEEHNKEKARLEGIKDKLTQAAIPYYRFLRIYDEYKKKRASIEERMSVIKEQMTKCEREANQYSCLLHSFYARQALEKARDEAFKEPLFKIPDEEKTA